MNFTTFEGIMTLIDEMLKDPSSYFMAAARHYHPEFFGKYENFKLTGEAKFRIDNYLIAYATLFFKPSEKRSNVKMSVENHDARGKADLVRDYYVFRTWIEE